MQTTPPADDYMSNSEFCQLVRISTRTSARWRAEGNFGPAFIRAGGHRVLYHRPTVEAWLRDRTFRHRADELVRSAA